MLTNNKLNTSLMNRDMQALNYALEVIRDTRQLYRSGAVEHGRCERQLVSLRRRLKREILKAQTGEQ